MAFPALRKVDASNRHDALHGLDASNEPVLQPLAGGLGAVPGFRLSGVHAGLKQRKPDLALIVADDRYGAAGCATTNDVKAAPVLLSMEHLAATGGTARAIVCNSGNANACTGAQGLDDARSMAVAASAAIGCLPEHVIIASTGVIGKWLPMEKISAGIAQAADKLNYGAASALQAARAIVTTDRTPKLSAYVCPDDDGCFVVGGIAKGSGMLAPRMATMLAFLGSNAPVGARALSAALSEACADSFNMISVDGDMSTNDAVYLLAPLHPDPTYCPNGFLPALHQVCVDLAVAMARDGEGATKLLQVTVRGATLKEQARAMARAIVNSILVKTAIFGADPNWGRIIAAAGATRSGFPPAGWSLLLNGTRWVENDIEVMSETNAHQLLNGQEVNIVLDLGQGAAYATGWGCDLTPDYVRINAHYRT